MTAAQSSASQRMRQEITTERVLCGSPESRASAKAATSCARVRGGNISPVPERSHCSEQWNFLQISRIVRSPGIFSLFQEAKEQGATDEEAFLAATLSAAANSAIEVSGGIETRPEDAANMTSAQKALEVVKTALDEGKEELFQNPVERLVNKAIIGTDNPYFSTTDESAVLNPYTSAKKFALGATVGGLMRGGQTLFQSAIGAGNQSVAQRQADVQEVASAPQQAGQTSYAETARNAVSEAPTAQDAAILETFAQGQKNMADTQSDSTNINDNPAQHTPQEQAVIEAYKSSAARS